jgi:hypothetical protein
MHSIDLWISKLMSYVAILVSKRDSRAKVDLSTGRKTSRERLLDILGQHVKQKKPRLSSRSVQSRRRSTFEGDPKPPDSNDVSQLPTPTPPTDQVNYERFNNSQLIDMLKDVGLDTDDLSRIELLKNCKIYTDLSEHDPNSISVDLI